MLSALDNKENMVEEAKAATLIKKDFFGRVIEAKPLAELDRNSEKRARREERKVWVTFHEGLNNAVRKPISLGEFLRGL
jgi:chromosome transmission fidelity protein 18